jgi:RHS repeat-associated protein
VEYGYNADGVRVVQSIDGQETRYLIDANQPYAEVLEEYTPQGATSVSYLYGRDLIAEDRAGQRAFYLVDGLGSTRALADVGGATTDRYTYDAFGRTIAQNGSTANTFLFAGEQFDSATGFYYLRARYYLPELGRFGSRDPFQGHVTQPVSLHPYLYAEADPVNRLDPSGRMTMAEQGIVAAIVNTLEGIATSIFRSAVQRVAVRLGGSVGQTLLRRLIGQIAGRQIAQAELRLLVRNFVRENLVGNLRGLSRTGLSSPLI